MKTSILFFLFLLLSFTLTINYAQTEWDKYADNPILKVGPAGSWDNKAVLGPSVIVDGEIYKMWYTGLESTTYRIGYATSPDGMGNPEPLM